MAVGASGAAAQATGPTVPTENGGWLLSAVSGIPCLYGLTLVLAGLLTFGLIARRLVVNHLERTVDRRTRDLRAANDALRAALAEARSSQDPAAAPGTGTAPPSAPAPVPPPPRYSAGDRQRILIAEDNPFNRDYLRRCFEIIGCDTRFAENGGMAVQAFQWDTFDLVLMDCHMPDVDGFTATVRIRSLEAAEPARGRTPIVAVTASTMAEDQDRCRASGMDDFLAKPFSPSQLRTVVERWLGRHPHATDGDDEEPSAEPPAVAILDPETLSDLRFVMSGTSGTSFEDLVTLFLTDTAQKMRVLQDMAARWDSKRADEVAHALRCSCAQFGANRLARCISFFQELLSRDDRASADLAIAHILEEFEQVRAAFRVEVANGTPCPPSDTGDLDLSRSRHETAD